MAVLDLDPQRDDRMLRYGARPLDQSKWILIRVDRSYASTYAGQIATLVAANLIGRLSQSVAIEAPEVPIVDPIPGAGGDLVTRALEGMVQCEPRGRYESWNDQANTPYIIHLGPDGHEEIVHGAGWLAYIGSPVSPLAHETHDPYNPVGPAFAAVVAATRMFVHRFEPPHSSRVFDCYAWRDCDQYDALITDDRPGVQPRLRIGDLWAVGCGSVGSAILYFLALSGAHFSTHLFDMDHVGVENITRSPIFTYADIGASKVGVVAAFLRAYGVATVSEFPVALDQAGIWQNRPPGVPDILIPAANERNVRHLIENNFPPLQIYGATGTNWQASVISHIPMVTGCSLCLFPDGRFPETACATDAEAEAANAHRPNVSVDASLPFLSFAAGLMAVADIFKAASGNYAALGRRGIYSTWDGPRLASAPSRHRSECACNNRDAAIYNSLLRGSCYAAYSYDTRDYLTETEAVGWASSGV